MPTGATPLEVELLGVQKSVCTTEPVISYTRQTSNHRMSHRPVLPAGAAAGGVLRAEVQRRAAAHCGPQGIRNGRGRPHPVAIGGACCCGANDRSAATGVRCRAPACTAGEHAARVEPAPAGFSAAAVPHLPAGARFLPLVLEDVRKLKNAGLRRVIQVSAHPGK